MSKAKALDKRNPEANEGYFARLNQIADHHPLREWLERVKGIEPSYSAWKSRNTAVFSKVILTFSVFLAH
ncbi:hypothetical protein [Bradyrhizobium sp. CCBAU 53351]|uniref:hypothetical protein n=1 Tax=Bradyrhizobium sp. CCBAU 53351 TaxID=1325114 RepID=UPI00188842BD|nr:hypothetical protein [Bradyrhizobium sp. CCBAU 53351]